ncbi:MAG: DUF4097 family beta strand repeat-containing protein [Cyclobacteriaceae bacterium]|nr:DUF4097 family beta strand repeat-containing protein [Cyclobacteriaceae bacterium]
MKNQSLVYLLALFALSLSTTLSAQHVLASHTFEAENIRAVTLHGSFCHVVISRGPKIYFNGRIEGNGREGDLEIVSDIQSDRLTISVLNHRGIANRITYAQLNLTVPEDVEVDIRTTSGNIQSTGFNARDYRFSATSGDISLAQLTGPVVAGTTSGNIKLSDVRGEISLSTTSGEQEVRNVNGSLQAVSTSGNIRIVRSNGQLIASSTSGNIELLQWEGSLTLKSTSGNITGNGLVLTGNMEFRASSGNVDMQVENEVEGLSFDLRASSGSLRVGNQQAEKTLYIKQGNYWVRGVTSSGNITFRNR